jgi:hypothetical protein
MRLQRLPIGLSFFCLLASPLLAAAAPASPFLRPGALHIAFDSAERSFLPVDVETLRQGLCTGFPDWDDSDRPPIMPAGECEMAVRSPPGLGLFTDGTSFRGSARVTVHPTNLPAWEGDTQIATVCGLWDVSMALDPGREQPISGLALEPSAEDSSQGVFAGVVQIAVLFHFANRTQGTSLDLPAVVPLDLAGHWAADSGTASPGAWDGGDDASNLGLFAGHSDGTWSSLSGYANWGVRPCRVFPVSSLPGQRRLTD